MGLPAPSNEPYFDQSKVDEVVSFIECLTLTKSTKSGKPEPFEVLQHSRDIITGIYGPRQADGRRVVEKVFASFGRKQAKTQTMAAIVAYEFFMGDEPMQEIYFVATATDQAAICYRAVADMIEADPAFEGKYKSTPSIRKIVNLENGNELKVLSADGKKQHGFNPSLVVFDELHAFGATEQELYDALTSGSMSRRNPLWLMITTAGSDKETICGREYDYAKKVLKKEVVDPTYLPIIYEVPENADWTDKNLWPMALPLLKSGHHELKRYEADFVKARQQPSEQNKFRRLYLNQWTSAETQWLPIHEWDECFEETPDEEFSDSPCWGGLDLGSTNDFTAFSLAFTTPSGKVVSRAWGYVPESTLDARSKRDGIQYRYWVERGWLRATKGNTTDWDEVFDHILELNEAYDLQAIAFDRWRIKYIEKQAEKAGIELIEWGQGFRDMAPAIEKFEDLVYNRKLVHNGNKAMSWNVNCAQATSDPAGNKKLVKPKTHQKSKHIDMVIASVMAPAAALLIEREVDPYANGGRLVAL